MDPVPQVDALVRRRLERMLDDLGIKEAGGLGERKAGMLPYVTLLAGAAVVLISNLVFTV